MENKSSNSIDLSSFGCGCMILTSAIFLFVFYITANNGDLLIRIITLLKK